jgi:phage terminase large subunit-like protein
MGDAHIVATTSPRAHPLVRRLLKGEADVVTRMRTADNLDHLSDAFKRTVVDRYTGTRLGRQELEGEYLEDAEHALFRRDWLERGRVDGAPSGGYGRTVVALDPADPGDHGSEQGLCVAARGREDGELYVIGSEAYRLSVGNFLARAIELALAHGAELVVERNFGGQAWQELAEQQMRQRGVRIPVRQVWASKGKRPRAETAGLLAEQGKLHLVGHQPELEDELCSWEGQRGERFDRGDALTWAVHELAGYGDGGPMAFAAWDEQPVFGSSSLFAPGHEPSTVAPWEGSSSLFAPQPPVSGEALDAWIRGGR